MQAMLLSSDAPVTPYRLIQRAIENRIIKSRKLSWEAPGLFDAVFFEVVNKCNSRCAFCGASVQNDRRPRKEMAPGLYFGIIRQLAAMEYAGRIAFHVANEPLLFNDLDVFVSHARSALPNASIQVMTNGLAFTPERGLKLISSGIDDLHVNFYRSSKKQKLPENLTRFIREVLPSEFPVRKGSIHQNPKTGARLRFTLAHRLIDEVRWSRGGTSPNRTATDGKARGLCLYPWKQLNISADGLVSKCCADIRFLDPLGDAASQPILDIWHGERFREVRRRLLKGHRGRLPNCRDCDFFGIPTEDISNPLLKFVKYHFFARY